MRLFDDRPHPPAQALPVGQGQDDEFQLLGHDRERQHAAGPVTHRFHAVIEGAVLGQHHQRQIKQARIVADLAAELTALGAHLGPRQADDHGIEGAVENQFASHRVIQTGRHDAATNQILRRPQARQVLDPDQQHLERIVVDREDILRRDGHAHPARQRDAPPGLGTHGRKSKHRAQAQQNLFRRHVGGQNLIDPQLAAQGHERRRFACAEQYDRYSRGRHVAVQVLDQGPYVVTQGVDVENGQIRLASARLLDEFGLAFANQGIAVVVAQRLDQIVQSIGIRAGDQDVC